MEIVFPCDALQEEQGDSRSDFMQFVGETGEVVAESHSEGVILKQAAPTLL